MPDRRPPDPDTPDDDGWTPSDSPTAWFAVLERARMTDDYRLAAEAVAQLARLGVTVRFPRRRKPAARKGGAA